jgi:RimJ/RimL family protein N-acetyltransferase
MNQASPPERIDASFVVLRRVCVEDAEAVAEAVRQSLDHLRPWMAWATPEAATEKAQRKRIAEEAWNAETEFAYVMLTQDEHIVVGGCGLGMAYTGHLAIGYWVHVNHIGRGYATAAAKALTEAAWSLPHTERVEIHCDPANVRSAAIPRQLGFRLERVLDHPIEAPGQTGKSMIWVLDRPSPPKREPVVVHHP